MQRVRVGFELLELARAAGARSIFIAGTGRDVGKTTVLRAIYSAAGRQDARIALASIGREGEAQTRGDVAKPRIWLQPQTIFVTTRGCVARTPAVRILKLSRRPSPAGPLLYARAALGGFYELVGPPTASAVREVVEDLCALAPTVVIDGAVDRVAALAGWGGAVIVAAGAASGATMQDAVEEIAALVARLGVPKFDEHAPALHIDGALTAVRAASFVAAREARQIVVGDPTQIALAGRAGSRALQTLTVRCRRPVRVVAATVASIGPQHSFEPRAFAQAVARATNLPTFDVYAGMRAA